MFCVVKTSLLFSIVLLFKTWRVQFIVYLNGRLYRLTFCFIHSFRAKVHKNEWRFSFYVSGGKKSAWILKLKIAINLTIRGIMVISKTNNSWCNRRERIDLRCPTGNTGWTGSKRRTRGGRLRNSVSGACVGRLHSGDWRQVRQYEKRDKEVIVAWNIPKHICVCSRLSVRLYLHL